MAKKNLDLQLDAVEPLYRLVSKCRMCRNSALTEYLDLGVTPPADQFRTEDELDIPEIQYPLKVVLCEKCGLSQLSHVVDKRVLYQYDYPYEQSTTKTGKSHWDDFAGKVVSELGLKPGDLAVDIGSNVGTLLGSFRSFRMTVCGIDPAPNIVKIANKENKIPTLCDFFGMKSARLVKKKFGPVSVIVGSNVFAHIDDLDEVMRSSLYLLKEDGVFIFESPHFLHLVENLEYDTIYHEHLSYLSAGPLVGFFARFGMEVFMIEGSDIHGGSFRVYVSRKGVRKIDSSVAKYLQLEKSKGIHDISTLRGFAVRVSDHRNSMVGLVERLIGEGKTLAAVSAPAKGMTLLNYCGFGKRQIQFVSEKARLKIGRFTPGGRIPIIADSELIRLRPDYAIILAWNFAGEIMDNLKDYRQAGGKFIIPIPDPKIV